jgi:hypothetical protein
MILISLTNKHGKTPYPFRLFDKIYYSSRKASTAKLILLEKLLYLYKIDTSGMLMCDMLNSIKHKTPRCTLVVSKGHKVLKRRLTEEVYRIGDIGNEQRTKV